MVISNSVKATYATPGYFEANWTGVTAALCPDLLTLSDIGVADNLRGRVVRAFFWVMRLWKT